jgi:hypothetical protein
MAGRELARAFPTAAAVTKGALVLLLVIVLAIELIEHEQEHDYEHEEAKRWLHM